MYCCLLMETLGPFKGVIRIYRGITPIMENQMEKNMENEMETRIPKGKLMFYNLVVPHAFDCFMQETL